MTSIQVRREIRKLRAINCSFEIVSRGSSASSSRVEDTSRPPFNISGWTRSPELPSWVDCFRCLFRSCVYKGPEHDSDPRGFKRHCVHPYFNLEGVVQRGLYVYQIEVWLRHFPPQQLLVLNNDEVRGYHRLSPVRFQFAIMTSSLLPQVA